MSSFPKLLPSILGTVIFSQPGRVRSWAPVARDRPSICLVNSLRDTSHPNSPTSMGLSHREGFQAIRVWETPTAVSVLSDKIWVSSLLVHQQGH